MKKINITIFAGGSGNKEFIEHINAISAFKLNIITNCYDDGKSTGRLRSLIPNMLGPSDVRKNVANLLNSNNPQQKILKKILEHRLRKIELGNFLHNFKIKKILNDLTFEKYQKISYYLSYIEKYFKKHQSYEKDMSLGNLILSGIFLKYNNFNYAVKVFNLLFLNDVRVFNVTNGKNLYLYSLREDGKILDEGEMVENTEKKIEDIFLLEKKIRKTSFANQDKLNKEKIIPSINVEVKRILLESDIIIYGPGTQYSSLFPSYITKNLINVIQKSKAKKIFVSNIFFDNDIHNESVEGLIKKFYYFFSINKTIQHNKLIDYFFINKFDGDDLNNINHKKYLQLVGTLKPKKKIIYIDWEKDNGKHYPGILIKEIIKILKNRNLKLKIKTIHTISIIVPCYNEEKKVSNVLSKLEKLNFENYNLQKEVIIVDGNSTDLSLQKIKKFKFCKIYSLKKTGKGIALSYGIKKAKGDIICFFPSDDEYNVEDIKTVIEPIISSNCTSVLGSRLIKCIDLSSQIKKVYKKNYFLYLLSKYGGMLLSTFFLLFYNRYITDPLSSIKAFKSDFIKKIKLESENFDYDIEIIAKTLNKKKYILEVPVKYKPRFKSQGKKITTIDGIQCLYKIIKYKFS